MVHMHDGAMAMAARQRERDCLVAQNAAILFCYLKY